MGPCSGGFPVKLLLHLTLNGQRISGFFDYIVSTLCIKLCGHEVRNIKVSSFPGRFPWLARAASKPGKRTWKRGWGNRSAEIAET